jgi:hypothetical protein
MATILIGDKVIGEIQRGVADSVAIDQSAG